MISPKLANFASCCLTATQNHLPLYGIVLGRGVGDLDQIPLPDAHVQLVGGAAGRPEIRLVLATQGVESVVEVVQPRRRGGGVLIRRRFQLHSDLLKIKVGGAVRFDVVLVTLVGHVGILAV